MLHPIPLATSFRALFAEAEEEEKRCGVNSGLHIIILDELDAICKQRGSAGAGSSGVDNYVLFPMFMILWRE